MGFFGTFVVARYDGPLAELPAMRQAGGDLAWSAHDGAWQIVQLHGGAVPSDSIGQETQGPVLIAQVIDSDVVAVEAASPRGPRWHCVLSPRTAHDSYGAPEQVLEGNEEAAPLAAGWAREAGREPDTDALATVLAAEADPFAEDLVLELVSALGFRFRETPEQVVPLACQDGRGLTGNQSTQG
ncbi:hypothetical protein [Streptomyces sp. JJ36]|uniref:hypothetical protein n=1 Tax=Streptomyces sp. JJ36 TaxID=2736645 RepID=UPI001F28D3A9|nr:hypothetical protein [Streptomyces sp. JJ36]MCF6525258.1 hypothetical protein [Streptomyces sp. JJ36]